MIELKGVYKHFGSVPVLEGVDLQVGQGEVVCLIGPSGSGKSTLLRCINGLESYSRGEILVSGQRVDRNDKSIHQLRTRVAMVFQRFNLFPHRTALENVMEGPIYVLKQHPQAGHGAARKSRSGPPHGRLPGRLVRRSAATRGDCPRAGHEPASHFVR